MKRRYAEWDYIANTLTEWKRYGKCKQCGACCRCKISFGFDKPFMSGKKAGGHLTNGEGIWQEVKIGRWRHFFRLIKINLDELGCDDCDDDTGLCGIYGNDIRSWICNEWPFSPRCIVPFPECGYSFEEIGHWNINEIEG